LSHPAILAFVHGRIHKLPLYPEQKLSFFFVLSISASILCFNDCINCGWRALKKWKCCKQHAKRSTNSHVIGRQGVIAGGLRLALFSFSAKIRYDYLVANKQPFVRYTGSCFAD
jgi:hypothetical protein